MPNIVNDIKLDFKDVLLRPKRSTLKSRADVDLYREMTFRNSKRNYRGVPIIASNMDTVGTFEMAKALAKHGLFTTVHKYYSPEEWAAFAGSLKATPDTQQNGHAKGETEEQQEQHQQHEDEDVLKHVAVSSGSTEADYKRLCSVLEAVPELQFVCLDVANGYTDQFVQFVRRVRADFPHITIIAGNVVTGEMAEELVLSGADIVKVGIGPGSVCTTRKKTGVGYPQLSAVMECADAVHGLGAHIISDGGCSSPGDVAKAFGGGADFVMVGGLLAGHDQCAGQLIEKPNGKKVKLFYGMSSETAMLKRSGTVASYRCSEGKTIEVEYKGDVEPTILDVLGGLRSACTYTGAAKLKELPRRATFIRCSQQTSTLYS